MNKRSLDTAELGHPKTLIIGVASPFNFIKDLDSYFEEFRQLVRSNGVSYEHELYMRLRTLDPGYLFTKGKLEEITKLCDDENIEEVIISEPLTVQQERNLEEMLRCKVFDRTQLILEIFEKNAHSAEGKKQVALAMLQHQKSRLAGRGISMSQQGGSIGTRGPGETQKEKETQHIEHLMTKIRRDLADLQKVRATQRKQRLSSNVPQMCLIGYTNAGKSTILNALTRSNVSAKDRLFETLDTTTRELFIDNKKKGTISDTVGFIQQLPHNLIEAFKSTLSELQYAHLLLHVVDSSDKNWESHIAVVKAVLAELAVEKPMLYVFNKIDQVPHREQFESLLHKYQPHVLISALDPAGIEPLIAYIRNWQP